MFEQGWNQEWRILISKLVENVLFSTYVQYSLKKTEMLTVEFSLVISGVGVSSLFRRKVDSSHTLTKNIHVQNVQSAYKVMSYQRICIHR